MILSFEVTDVLQDVVTVTDRSFWYLDRSKIRSWSDMTIEPRKIWRSFWDLDLRSLYIFYSGKILRVTSIISNLKLSKSLLELPKMLSHHYYKTSLSQKVRNDKFQKCVDSRNKNCSLTFDNRLCHLPSFKWWSTVSRHPVYSSILQDLKWRKNPHFIWPWPSRFKSVDE